jgi:glycogen debranching enzyme
MASQSAALPKLLHDDVPEAPFYIPTLYPVACAPQAWASATPFTLIEASLGLQFDPAGNAIRLHNPSLPSFLDEMVLRDLQLNEASVDIKLRRNRSSVSVEVIEQRGALELSIVFG